jgi:hypothetical protein
MPNLFEDFNNTLDKAARDTGDFFRGGDKAGTTFGESLNLEEAPPQADQSLPSREDVVTQILSEQIKVLEKRRQGILGQTTPSPDATKDNLASTTLFGV